MEFDVLNSYGQLITVTKGRGGFNRRLEKKRKGDAATMES